MGFFDNLGKKASAAYDATAEKTSKIAKEAKFRMKINEDKSEINNIYKEIGKKVYEKHVREENIDIKAELEEECTKLDVLSAEIETCLKSILELKEKKQCEQCHSEIDLDATFCPKCGAKQPEMEVKEVEIVDGDAKSEETSNQDDIKQDENSNNTGDSEQEDSNNMKDSEQGVQENNEGDNTSSENTVEKVTEVMSVETQENAKESANQEQ
jgi:RNA polymerase subunit RPABC4/transcription elongation factor Spt4